jgi:hypothetical protein
MEPSSPFTATAIPSSAPPEVAHGVPEEQYNLVKQRLKEMTEVRRTYKNVYVCSHLLFVIEK